MAAPSVSSPVSSSSKPQYGGTLTIASSTSPSVWDPAANGQLISANGNATLVNEQNIVADWTQGLGGTGKVDWAMPNGAVDTYGGGLAQSWKVTAPGTVVMQVRQGVHWALDPDSPASVLMNGREVTVNDWLENFDYLMHTAHSSLQYSEPQLVKDATMTQTGPWEVTLKVLPSEAMDAWLWLDTGGGFYYLLPSDVVKKYGSMQDWHNVVGTGPFMLTDFVPDSSVTYKRNPNYWGIDPLGAGKGNQLPYVDYINQLIIPDISTEEAAVRTGKIDMLNLVQTNDAKSMMKTTPDLKNHSFFTEVPMTVDMRTDQTALPFSNVQVRQALMMATDENGLSSTLYGGDAETQMWPVLKEAYPNLYVPMAQLPQSVQSLYQYNPDGAKKLLAQAGYPNGFKATMVVEDLSNNVDIASALAAMWAKIGVDVTLQPKEVGVFNSMWFSRNYDQMILRPTFNAYSMNLMLTHWQGPNFDNGSYVDDPAGNDPTIDAAHALIEQNLFVDWAKCDEAFRNLTPYLMQQVYYIPTPSPRLYNIWWPWVKNYYGQGITGFLEYQWIDKNLKTQMGH